MKKVILLLTLLLFATIGWSQTTFYTANHSTIRFYDKATQQWPEWDEWSECEIIVTINLDRNEVNIYSATHQKYVILQYGEKEIFQKYEKIVLMALDEEGIRCNLELIKYVNGESHIYIKWSDLQLGYQIVLR